MKISNLVDEIGTINRQAADLYKQYKVLKESEDKLRQELMIELSESGLKSAKTDRFIASTSTRHDFLVENEHTVREWLTEQPDVEEDFYIGLKLTPFKTLAKEVLKKSGEIIPGTELTSKETITIKGNK